MMQGEDNSSNHDDGENNPKVQEQQEAVTSKEEQERIEKDLEKVSLFYECFPFLLAVQPSTRIPSIHLPPFLLWCGESIYSPCSFHTTRKGKIYNERLLPTACDVVLFYLPSLYEYRDEPNSCIHV
jgi:hypothetical protein